MSMMEYRLEAELRLCLMVLRADGEITDREIAFAVRHILSRYHDVSQQDVLKLIENLSMQEKDLNEVVKAVGEYSSAEELTWILLSVLAIIFTDGAAEEELEFFNHMAGILGYTEEKTDSFIALFDASLRDFRNNPKVVTLGPQDKHCDVPLFISGGELFFFSPGNNAVHEETVNEDASLFLVVRDKSGMVFNSKEVYYDFFVSPFSENDYLSLGENRYTFDYWNVRSFFTQKWNGLGGDESGIDESTERPSGKEGGERFQLVLMEGEIALTELRAGEDDEGEIEDDVLASAVMRGNTVEIIPLAEGVRAAGNPLEKGKKARVFNQEIITHGEYPRAVRFYTGFSRSAFSFRREGLESIALAPLDGDLEEECYLSVTGMEGGYTVDVTAYAGRAFLEQKSRRGVWKETGLPASVKGGDRLRLSRLLITLPDGPGEDLFIEKTRVATLQVEGLSLRFDREGPEVLKDISFSLHAGELTAILGPAGSGKSTLLNALLGLTRPSAGRVLVNGNECTYGLKEVNDYLGYVPQDDLLIDVLTVWENLYYSYRLRNPRSSLTRDEVQRRIDETLERVGLFHKRESLVGNAAQRFLSGGERRRLNIALELINDPDIIILDEPTSGLSSMDAESLVSLLRSIANSGKLLLMVVHQPSSSIYRMLDNTVILNTDGRLAFFGNNIRALTLFSEVTSSGDRAKSGAAVECPVCKSLNPDLLLRTLNLETESFWQVSKELSKTARAGITEAETGDTEKKQAAGVSKTTPMAPAAPLPQPRRIGLLGRAREFGTQVSRLARCKLRDRGNLILTMVVSPLLGFFAAFLLRYSPGESYNFVENPHYLQYLFLVVVAAVFFGLSSSIAEILNDRLILKREKITRLSRGVYLKAKTWVLFLLTAVQSLLFLLPAQAALGDLSMFPLHFFLMLIIALSSIGLGLFISTFVKTVFSAYTLVPFILIPQIVLGGLFIDFDKMNPLLRRGEAEISGAPAIAQVIHARWAFEMLAAANVDFSPLERLQEREKREKAKIDSNTEISKLEKLVAYDKVRKKYQAIARKTDLQVNEKIDELSDLPTGDFLAPRQMFLKEVVSTWKVDLFVLLGFALLALLLCFVRIRKYPK